MGLDALDEEINTILNAVKKRTQKFKKPIKEIELEIIVKENTIGLKKVTKCFHI